MKEKTFFTILEITALVALYFVCFTGIIMMLLCNFEDTFYVNVSIIFVIMLMIFETIFIILKFSNLKSLVEDKEIKYRKIKKIWNGD